MKPGDVERILQLGADAGCTEALFTFGEHPEEVEGFSYYLDQIGYASILEYCRSMSEIAIRYGLLPHTNAGLMTREELLYLKDMNASMGLMLETTADIPAHKNSPGKLASRRIEMIEEAGRLHIPFTTGLLIGIGETLDDRSESLKVIADIHRRYENIQEVIIQNFCPKPGTNMSTFPGASYQDMVETVRLASTILPPDISIQIPPNLADAERIIKYGVTDLGGISPVTIDYVNPEHPWPALREIRQMTAGYDLRERLCIYPGYINKGWFPDSLKDLIFKLEDRIRMRGS